MSEDEETVDGALPMTRRRTLQLAGLLGAGSAVPMAARGANGHVGAAGWSTRDQVVRSWENVLRYNNRCRIRYLGSVWDEHGDPEGGAGWRHHFMSESYAAYLTNLCWEDCGSSNWQLYPEMTQINLDRTVQNNIRIEGAETDGELNVAVSARRDADLFGFVDPDRLESMLEEQETLRHILANPPILEPSRDGDQPSFGGIGQGEVGNILRTELDDDDVEAIGSAGWSLTKEVLSNVGEEHSDWLFETLDKHSKVMDLITVGGALAELLDDGASIDDDARFDRAVEYEASNLSRAAMLYSHFDVFTPVGERGRFEVEIDHSSNVLDTDNSDVRRGPPSSSAPLLDDYSGTSVEESSKWMFELPPLGHPEEVRDGDSYTPILDHESDFHNVGAPPEPSFVAKQDGSRRFGDLVDDQSVTFDASDTTLGGRPRSDVEFEWSIVRAVEEDEATESDIFTYEGLPVLYQAETETERGNPDTYVPKDIGIGSGETCTLDIDGSYGNYSLDPGRLPVDLPTNYVIVQLDVTSSDSTMTERMYRVYRVHPPSDPAFVTGPTEFSMGDDPVKYDTKFSSGTWSTDGMDISWSVDEGSAGASSAFEVTERGPNDSYVKGRFTEDGEHTVRASISYPFNERGGDEVDTDEVSVSVDDGLTAVIEGPDVVSRGEEVTFDGSESTVYGTEIESFEWVGDVGAQFNGQVRTESVDVTFEETGQYTAKLEVTDAEGDTVTTTTEFEVADGPSAKISVPSSVLVDDSVTFDASDSTAEPDAPIASYEWSGEAVEAVTGSSSQTGASFDGSFSAAGSYDVTLGVTDENDVWDEATATIEVVAEPTLDVSVTTPESECLVGSPIQFEAAVAPSSLDVTRFDWSFDQSTDSATASHTFDSPASYRVGITAVRADAEDLETSISVDILSELDVDIVANGSTGGVAVSPDADDQPVSFEASVTPEGEADAFEWVIPTDPDAKEPPSPKQGQRVTERFPDVGTFEVQLTAERTTGGGDTTTARATAPVVVSDDPEFSIEGPDGVMLDDTPTYRAVEPSDPDGSIERYEWFVDDEMVDSGETPIPDVETSFDSTGSHEVALVLEDDAGVTERKVHPVSVTDNWSVEASASASAVPPGESVTFDAAVTGLDDPSVVEEFTWTFDLSDRRTGQSVSRAFDDTGEYLVTVSATYRNETVSDDLSVTVSEAASFELQGPTGAMADEEISVRALDVSDPDGSVSSYEWFVDGSSVRSESGKPSKLETTFDSTGDHQVSLAVTDDDGVTVEKTHEITVTEAYDVSASASKTVVEPDESVGFEASVTPASARDRIDSYSWTFGFGESAEGRSPTHSFDEAGEYEVTVSVASEAGDTVLDSVSMTVTSAPTFDLQGPSGAMAGDSVSVRALEVTDSDGSVASYEWFVDGSSVRSGSGKPSKLETTFDSTGDHRVSLAVTDDEGMTVERTHALSVTESYDVTATATEMQVAPDESVGFEATVTPESIADAIDSYSWTFEFGESAEGRAPTHSFEESGEYEVTVSAAHENGDTVIDSVRIVVNRAPSFELQGPSGAMVDEEISVRALDVSDPDGSVSTYEWLVDGSSVRSGSGNPSKLETTFDSTGDHQVELLVTDDDLGTTRKTHEVTVTEAYNVTATADKTVAAPGEAVSFDANVTPASAADSIESYSWTFEFKESSELRSPSYAFDEAGEYKVTVSAAHENGDTVTDYVSVTVEEPPNQAPSISVSASPSSPTEGETVTFSANPSDPDGYVSGSDVSWSGDVGGTGGSKSITNPSAGTYSATAVVTDADGATAQDSASVTIEEPPNQAPSISVSASPSSPTEGETVTFSANPSDPDGYVSGSDVSWSGDVGGTGGSKSITNPSAGTYSATAVVTDADGATAQDSASVTIEEPPNQAPSISVSHSPSDPTTGQDLTFSASVSDPDGNVSGSDVLWSGDVSGTGGSKTISRAARGTYRVTATVTDADGASTSDSDSANVDDPFEQPGDVDRLPEYRDRGRDDEDALSVVRSVVGWFRKR